MPKDFHRRAANQVNDFRARAAETRYLFNSRDKPSHRYQQPSPGDRPALNFAQPVCFRVEEFQTVMRFFSDFKEPFLGAAQQLLGPQRVAQLREMKKVGRAPALVKLFIEPNNRIAELGAWALAGMVTPELLENLRRNTPKNIRVSPCFQIMIASRGERLRAVAALLRRRAKSPDCVLEGIENLISRLANVVGYATQSAGVTSAESATETGLLQVSGASMNQPGISLANVYCFDHGTQSSRAIKAIPEKSADVKPQVRLRILEQVGEFIHDFGGVARACLGRGVVRALVRAPASKKVTILLPLMSSSDRMVQEVAMLVLLSIYSPSVHNLVCSKVEQTPQVPDWFAPLKNFDGDLRAVVRAVLDSWGRTPRRRGFAFEIIVQRLEQEVRVGGMSTHPGRHDKPR